MTHRCHTNKKPILVQRFPNGLAPFWEIHAYVPILPKDRRTVGFNGRTVVARRSTCEKAITYVQSAGLLPSK